MKIFLLGNGKLGRSIEKEAHAMGHTVVAIGTSLEIPWEKIASADVCIDCTNSDAFQKNLPHVIAAKKPLVAATTGIEAVIPHLKEQFKEVGCLVSPNFSLGFACFYLIAKQAAKLAQFFDVAGLEVHHSQKKDAPSGSAKELQKLFLKSPPFSSVRVGESFGTHTLYFDSGEDAIVLTHQAKARSGFARGALLAAEWIATKKGFFTMEDFIDDTFS